MDQAGSLIIGAALHAMLGVLILCDAARIYVTRDRIPWRFSGSFIRDESLQTQALHSSGAPPR